MNSYDNPSFQGGAGTEDVESDLARLLRAAGPRPEPPGEDKELVKAAARAQWEWTVRRERRRRIFRRAAVALAAAAALAFVSLNPTVLSRLGLSSGVSLGTLEIAAGDVFAARGGERVSLSAGSSLQAGMVLETGSSSDSRAAIQLAGGSALRLDAGSRLTVLFRGILALERGAVYVDSGVDGDSVEIRTPLGEVRDIGTRFEVRLEDGLESLRVRVRDGAVELHHEGSIYAAGAGQEMLQRADGSHSRTDIEPYGRDWEWVLAAPPPFVIEGRSLGEFLAWAAHEQGRDLAFSDQALEAAAEEVVLYGSVEGLGLEEAVTAMLAGSGLSHRIENGTLLVEKAP